MPSFTAALIGLSLSGLLLTACSAKTQPIADPIQASEPPLTAVDPSAAQAGLTQAEILDQLVMARVVYLAEVHTSEADHAAQLEIIRALHERSGDVAERGAPPLAIAMEMFQRPFQPVLDAYLAGEITEDELVAQSEYETRWGFPWELYAPIVRYAQANQLPLIALNTPAEVTRKVSRNGLASLSGDDLTYIPPISEIDTKNVDYQAFFAEITGFNDSDSPHGSAHGGFDFDNFFSAQVLWDETMAAGTAEFAEANPETQVIVLAGQGHIAFDYGIPDRVQRRLGDDLVDYSVILTPAEDIATLGTGPIGDFVWPEE
ncbi:MAG: ChaN family lipoprotein [Cyanobacteria bacterium J06648_16]